MINLLLLDNTVSILDQLDALPVSTTRLVLFAVRYNAAGMSDIDCPISANFAGIAFLSTNNAKTVFLIPENNISVYRRRSSNGVWRSSWENITFSDLT